MIPSIGVFQNIPADVYHSWEACSNSQLSILYDESPASLKASWSAPEKQTPAKIIGTAVHCRTLEPELFKTWYGVLPEVNKKTNDGKAELKAFKADNPNVREWLDPKQMELVQAVSASVESHPQAAYLLSRSVDRELSIVWEDRDTGLLCKGRLDLPSAHSDGMVLVDLKTAESVKPDKFQKAIFERGYYRQAGMYLMGMQFHGMECADFSIIAVEKDPPYQVMVYCLDPDDIERGHWQVKKLMYEYADCLRTNVFPTYGTGAQPLELSRWQRQQIDQQINQFKMDQIERMEA